MRDIRIAPKQSAEEAWCDNAVGFLSDETITRLAMHPELSDRDTWELVRAIAPEEAVSIETDIGPPPWTVKK